MPSGPSPKTSIEGKLFATVLLSVALGTSIPFGLLQLGAHPILAWSAGLLLALILAFALLRPITRNLNRALQSLEGGLLNFRDGDFSISLALNRDDQLGQLAELYNEVGEILRRERAHIHQRELLLDTVIQSSPLALLLIDQSEHIIFANTSARHMLHDGKPLQGHLLGQIMPLCPPELAQAIEQKQDGLTSYLDDERSHTLHISNSTFVLNAQKHRLILLREMTRELTRAEVQVWKKVIRLISHELNNSLAPISSMAHSGKLLSEKIDSRQLAGVFDVIADRCRHLTEFTQGYARFAKLPPPVCEEVPWSGLITRLQPLHPFQTHGSLPSRPGYFDPTQLEQALLNLLKNAAESGSAVEDITLQVATDTHGQLLTVRDRGTGMSDKVLQQALLPFYSTKPQGVGLGLALCREIIDAHNGQIQLHNRAEGGLQVSLWLPWQGHHPQE
ncbi:PAS domain-containing protein [Microbulbifer elongatus]|uniref:histidine kinase n=1 Tax=Microbulbifer elongatus TaxID=86173 RepID=A0ABT1NXZ0_9GAMM|nr:ATP-binding protein [Microbulbifer elongatus]MCQ3828152.1 PAS domain-containing protein [Microbulbifer elongatus]